MKNSAERIQFITDYIFSYENKIKELNKQGLFNDAKMFELFASKVGELYLGLSKPLINLNIETSTYPCVDLFSEDGNIFCQVSTCQNIPEKISKTLNKIKDSTDEKISSIKEVYFIVLNNESVSKVKDITIGAISFNKSKNLITTGDIVEKSKNDLNFQEALYILLKKEDDLFKNDFKKYQEAINYDSKVILDDIDEYINKSYYIDLSKQINEINLKRDKFILISGEAGSGKSVLCKKILENKKNVLCARAEKLVEVGDVNKIWNFNLIDTLSLVKDEVYIYIDALEFIADNRNKLDTLDSLLERIMKLDNTYLLCSCRSNDLNSFIKTISKYKIIEYKTKPVDDCTLNDISKKLPVLTKIIANAKYNSLLVSPFYINFLTRLDNFNSINDENQLRKKIWKEIICLNDDTIDPIITNIVLERANKFVLYSDASNYDKGIIDNLVSNGVLIKKENGIRLKYDIFEDICFEQYIDNLFDNSKGNYSLFFKDIDAIGRCIYRRYQIWIENKLFSKTNRKKFLYTLVSTKNISDIWEKQSIIGIIKSMYCKEFFEEYASNLLANDLIIKFIDITNIYAFEIDKISFDIGAFMLKNKGYGRDALIKIIYESGFYKSNLKNENSIKKLIYDYTNLITSDEISNDALEILKYYIDKALERYLSYDLIKKEIEAIYKLHKVADSWIKDFFKRLKDYFFSDNEKEIDFANDAIKDILSMNCSCLIKQYSNYMRDFFDIYYTTIKEEKNDFYYHDNLNRNIIFGLNYNADNYDYESFNVNPNYFYPLFILLRKSFWSTCEWYLGFINKCINTFRTKSDVNTYKIYFSNNLIKEYYGTSEMWMIGEYQNNMPTLLSDMTFVVKSVIIEVIKNNKLVNKNDFANNIKKMIFEKSNNIIGLSIISNVGLTFINELPGYCLELASSLEIVLDDLSRYALTGNNSARKMLENEMAKKVGVPDLAMNRYNSINPNNELRNYTILTQLKYPNLKNKYYEIFDYLYSIIKNDKKHASLYLQLQQMDIRNASVNKVDSNLLEIVPNVDGAAKDISDIADERNKSISIICEKINNISDSLVNKTISVQEIDILIKELLKYENNSLTVQFNNILITCISYALRNLFLDLDKRNEYCLLLVKYAKKQLNNEPIIIDANLYQALFEQLNENIDTEIKNEIKNIILDLLLKKNNDGIRYQIFNEAKKFLLSNKKYSKMYLNTIFLLAEDEMNHQIYNYSYLCNYHNDENIDFIPNMQPRLDGVDYYIEQDHRKKFKSQKGKIIKKYLLEEQDFGYSKMEIRHLDIKIVANAFSCGLNLVTDNNFISFYLKQLVEIYNEKSNKAGDIVGYYEVLEVEEYFKKCLLDSNLYLSALNILFENIDFQKFTSNTIDLYLNVLASLTAYYFDSYKNKEQRKHIENVINLMEMYINNISVEWVKKELSKALILGFSRFGGSGDWSKYKTSYDYSDKMFLNDIFSKYGYLHFNDLLAVIYHLQYNKLLPEILISINNSFKKCFVLNWKRIEEKEKIINFINEIMYCAFVNYESEIKGDSDLITAFEGILLLLIELKDEKSAVLLDEFRTH